MILMIVKVLVVTDVIMINLEMVFVTMDVIRIAKKMEVTANHWNPEYKV